MSQMNTLVPAPGSRKKTKRLGRGCGSGQGCTAGKGNKGDRSRSGCKEKFYFEGGQTPMTRRIPKRGFKNRFSIVYQIVNVGDLEQREIPDSEIDTAWLFSNGLIHSQNNPVKILGGGELTKKISVKANAFSKSAREKIEKAKGKLEVVSRA